jgi:signal transduction histidine kinase/DNA-binding response OmpR family regulator
MSEDIEVLKRTLERERQARKQAEQLLEVKSREVYLKNTELTALAERLEHLVEERTRELEEARDDAVEANRSKSQFLANMSHELRTPLNAILGYSEILCEDGEAAGQTEVVSDLKKIRSAGMHLLSLINDVLDLSKIEAGQVALYEESIDVAQLVADVVSTMQPILDKNQNRFEVQAEQELGNVWTDVTKLRQILYNLLSNGAKFTSGGTVTLRVERVTGSDREELFISVRDTGIGMTPAQIAGLFVPFRQADASTSRKYGGTGLGLTITERFCKMLGGTLHVESEPGVGSHFSIRLPVTGPGDESRTFGAEGDTQGRLGTVLVIDDDPVVRDLMRRMLTSEGFGVITAGDGQEGLERARKERPAAITLDVLMPKLDGWAFLSALQADAELSHIPVIVVSIVDQRGMGLALGASAFVPKPIERERLVNELLKHVRPPANVLVVDDDLDCLELVERTLLEHGLEVTCADSGERALGEIAVKHPDLVLLDLKMPGLDGFDVVEHMQQNEALRSIPILVMTSKDLNDEDRARLSGVELVLEKHGGVPTNLVHLVQRLARRPRPGAPAGLL